MTMEDLNFIDEDQMNMFGDFISEEFVAAVFGEEHQYSYSSDSLSPNITFSTPSPPELEAAKTCFQNPTKYSGAVDAGSLSGSRISQGAYVNQQCVAKSGQGKRGRTISPATKSTSCTQDHIIAERKRREKLSQQFIALTAIVPGLKKVDKTSVLGDTIKYIKELQERLKTLEEQNVKKTMESVVFVKKFQIPSEDNSSASDENSNEPLPEIEARISDKNVLIRIHCEKRKGVLVKALAAIEKLHLSVINSSTMPFGNSTLDITVMAQMEEEFDVAGKDLVEKLRSAFHQFM